MPQERGKGGKSPCACAVSLNSNNKSGTRGIYRWKSASGVWYWKAIINNNIGHQLQRLFREEDDGFKKAIDQRAEWVKEFGHYNS